MKKPFNFIINSVTKLDLPEMLDFKKTKGYCLDYQLIKNFVDGYPITLKNYFLHDNSSLITHPYLDKCDVDENSKARPASIINLDFYKFYIEMYEKMSKERLTNITGKFSDKNSVLKKLVSLYSSYEKRLDILANINNEIYEKNFLTDNFYYENPENILYKLGYLYFDNFYLKLRCLNDERIYLVYFHDHLGYYVRNEDSALKEPLYINVKSDIINDFINANIYMQYNDIDIKNSIVLRCVVNISNQYTVDYGIQEIDYEDCLIDASIFLEFGKVYLEMIQLSSKNTGKAIDNPDLAGNDSLEEEDSENDDEASNDEINSDHSKNHEEVSLIKDKVFLKNRNKNKRSKNGEQALNNKIVTPKAADYVVKKTADEKIIEEKKINEKTSESENEEKKEGWSITKIFVVSIIAVISIGAIGGGLYFILKNK
ncbi:hypothetical protein GVAV_001028 [Gurleya vavrai]